MVRYSTRQFSVGKRFRRGLGNNVFAFNIPFLLIWCKNINWPSSTALIPVHLQQTHLFCASQHRPTFFEKTNTALYLRHVETHGIHREFVASINNMMYTDCHPWPAVTNNYVLGLGWYYIFVVLECLHDISLICSKLRDSSLQCFCWPSKECA